MEGQLTGKQLELDHRDQFYMHKPQAVKESRKYMVQAILVGRLDLVIVNKEKKICQTEDVSVPANLRMNLKEKEKLDKYIRMLQVNRKYCRIRKCEILFILTGLICFLFNSISNFVGYLMLMSFLQNNCDSI